MIAGALSCISSPTLVGGSTTCFFYMCFCRCVCVCCAAVLQISLCCSSLATACTLYSLVLVQHLLLLLQLRLPSLLLLQRRGALKIFVVLICASASPTQDLSIKIHMQTIEEYLADHSDERNSFDACTCLLVLCSVPQPAPLVSDLCTTCLKPGGKLVFVEHVAPKPGSIISLLFRAVQPVWGLVGDGCQLSRPTADTIARNGAWSSVHVEPAKVSSWIPIPWVKGWAIKEESSGSGGRRG